MGLPATIRLILVASIVLNVFGLGLGATQRDLTCVLRNPAMLVRSLLPMNVLMPVMAALLAALFHLLPAVKIALVALAVSPVPPLLPKRTQWARGESSYTFGLLVAASVFAFVYIPAALEVIGWIFGVPLRVPASKIAVLVLITIVIPLISGVVARSIAPRAAARLVNPASIMGMLLLAAGLLPVLLKAWPAIVSLIGNGALAAILAFTVFGLAAGHALGGPTPERRTVLALFTAFRHPGIAVVIAETNFPEQKLVPAAVLLYLVVGAIIAIPYMRRQGRIGIRPAPAL